MTTLDLTAHADEFREIAAKNCGEGAQVRTLIYLYGAEGHINPGLCQQIREQMTRIENYGIRPSDYANRAVAMFNLGKLLGHVSPLEDAMREGTDGTH